MAPTELLRSQLSASYDKVAVVQATVTEKRTYKGQDTSGHGSWMDVFVKRGDKWVIVRTLGARVI